MKLASDYFKRSLVHVDCPTNCFDLNFIFDRSGRFNQSDGGNPVNHWVHRSQLIVIVFSQRSGLKTNRGKFWLVGDSLDWIHHGWSSCSNINLQFCAFVLQLSEVSTVAQENLWILGNEQIAGTAGETSEVGNVFDVGNEKRRQAHRLHWFSDFTKSFLMLWVHDGGRGFFCGIKTETVKQFKSNEAAKLRFYRRARALPIRFWSLS